MSQKLENIDYYLIVYNLLNRLSYYLSQDDCDSALIEFNNFIASKENVGALFIYFITDKRFVPSNVLECMNIFINDSVLSKFIKLVPTTIIMYTSSIYLDGPCNLRFIYNNMMKATNHNWDTIDWNSEELKKVIRYVKLKLPREVLDI